MAFKGKLTETPKDTRRYTTGEALIQIIAAAQAQELFLLGWRKVLQATSSSCQRSVELKSKNSDVGLTKRRCAGCRLVLSWGVGRVDSGHNDSRTGYHLTSQISRTTGGLVQVHGRCLPTTYLSA